MMRRYVAITVTLMLAVGMLAFVLLTQLDVSQAATAVSMARLRVLHASPDAPPVDVLANGTDIFTNAAYSALTPYISVPSGTYTITLEPAMGGNAVYTQMLTVMGDTDYTVAAAGTFTTVDTFDFTLMPFVDDNETVPGLGKTRARFIHLSPGAPEVDIAVSGGPTLFSNVAYGASGGYVEVPSDIYVLEVQLSSSGLTALTATVPVDPNSIYSFFAIGFPAGMGPLALQALPSLDMQYARVRAFHGIFDAPAVDVQVNGAPAFVGVMFQDLSDYAALPPGTYTVGIAPTGVMTPVITDTFMLSGGMDYTVAAAGTLTTTDPYTAGLVPFVDNNLAPAAGNAHLRFIHLVPGAPGVDVGLQGGPVLITNTVYQSASAYLPVAAGAYDLEGAITGGGMVVATLNHIWLLEGVIYDAIAVPSETPMEVDVVLVPVHTIFMPVIARNG